MQLLQVDYGASGDPELLPCQQVDTALTPRRHRRGEQRHGACACAPRAARLARRLACTVDNAAQRP